MLRKSGEIVPEVKANLRGGEGEVATYTFVTQQEGHDTGRLYAKLVLLAGASIGMHEHVGEFEIYYVLEGNGVVNDGEKDYEIAPGDVYLCDDGERHSLTNTGAGPLAIVAIIPFTK